jgi:gamma-glutamyltranspeptidase/glutathione hydrolase
MQKILKFLKLFLLISSICFFSNCSIIKLNQSSSYNQDDWNAEGYYGFDNYKTVIGNKFMIATSEKIASEVGAKILKEGGNAIDSAIAVQMVLNVIEPQSSGIGGGLFLIYHDHKTKKNLYFNGRETAPSNSYPEMFLDNEGKPKKFDDVVNTGYAVATPGVLKALKLAHKKYGKLPWAQLFQPAIDIAKNGYPISKKMAINLASIKHLSSSNSLKIYFDQNHKPKKIGTIIKNYQLARTLEIIAKEGIKPFYEGNIANNIEMAVSNNINPSESGAHLTKKDLKKYQATTGNLICDKYRNKYKICSMPLPSSGGITILQTLSILENFDLSKLSPNSLEAVHIISEALKLSYADRNQYLADIANVPIKEMLDKKYTKERANLINLNLANNNIRAGDFKTARKIIYPIQEKPSTTHFSIIDQNGNAVSLTSSIEFPYGSAIGVDGFLLNNVMTDFSFIPKINNELVVNRIEPLKYPRSSMSPTFVFDDKNNLILVVGSPNGPRIIQHVLKTIIAVLDWNIDLQEAVSMPNFISLNGFIELEKNTNITTLKKPLQKLKHQVKIIPITSAIQAIKITNNKFHGASDPRRQGFAIGE